MHHAADAAPAPADRLPLASARDGRPPYLRGAEVAVRAIHLVAMGLVLGGIRMGGTHETLLGPIVATVSSGLALLWISTLRGCLRLHQGAGWALLAKLALLGLGNVFPGSRLPFYAAATVISGVGSHMPAAWRHCPLPGRALRAAGTRAA